MKKQSIWVFQWRKSVHYWWSYILFSPECKELTSMLDPLLYRWGVPPVVIRCVHWTMQMWVLQTWIKALGLYIVMSYGLMQNCNSFQPVSPLMGYSFPDLWTEGCCHSLNALSITVKCHYNANASLTRSILGSKTAPTCPHDHPRVAQHMG